MLENLIGVSPPLQGKAQDSKVELNKDLKDTSSKGQYKNDFEKALKEKLALRQKEKKEDKAEKTEVNPKKDDKELRAEVKEKKSSGGTKKKMTEKNENSVVSNNMASVENEVEIPESKTDLAETEENKNKAVEVSGGQKSLFDLMAQQKQANDLLAANQIPVDQASQAQAQLAEGLMEFQQASLPAEQNQVQGELKNEAQVQTQTQVLQAEKNKVYNFEQELGAQVGFQAAADQTTKSEELLQKLKTFEVEKNISAEKVQDFEKSVFDQLQKMSSGQVSAKMTSDSSDMGEQKSGDQTKQDDFAKTNLKMDNYDGLSHVGQSHADFKAHLATTVTPAAELAHMNRLEENHDQNIKEIMNQAQYLVKQGGGEMNVKMSPDGLAEVQLKVVLQDGRVNVEMHTQDKAVRKLIEESLSDLKSGLAAQHLSVNHVKINTVTATNTDNTAQFQSNWNQGSSDQKQRELWDKFQNSARRSSYAAGAETKAVKATESATRPAASSASSLRTYGGKKGSQINRVA